MIFPTARTVTGVQAKTRQGRVCLFDINSNAPFDKVTPRKEDNHYTVKCYPNYEVINHQVIVNSILPPQSIQLPRHKELRVQYYVPEKDPSFLSLNSSEAIKSVGQILVVYVTKPDPKQSAAMVLGNDTQGTCFLTQLQVGMQPQIISVFHVLSLEPSDEFEIFAVANFSEIDLGSCLADIRQEFEDKGEANHLKIYEARAQHILQRLKAKLQKKLKQQTSDLPLYLLDINQDFLQVRRQYLTAHVEDEGFVRNNLLDPLFHMKPSPAVDLAIFDVPQELEQNKNISCLTIGDLEDDEEIILIMFACPDRLKMETNKEEYGEIFSGDKDFEEVMDGLLLAQFIHPNKSASFGKIYKTTTQIETTQREASPIIIYYGSTCAGASGAPLLNHKGKVIAFNFANYQDQESSEPPIPNDVCDNQFDVNVSWESKERYKECKNCNLALSMRHPVIQEYLEFLQRKPALNLPQPNASQVQMTQGLTQPPANQGLMQILGHPNLLQPERSLLQKRQGEDYEPEDEKETKKQLHQ